tara:strand:+ start:455 stop:658 length:204 start_codon:yes stop_codon:yes gene_type:complete
MIATVVNVVLRALGLRKAKAEKGQSVTQALEKLDTMQAQVHGLESVTMTWTTAELTPEQRQLMGLEE